MVLIAYTKVNFVDGSTPLNKANLGNMDDYIAVLDAVPKVPTVVNGQWLKGSGGAAVWSALAAADIPDISATYAKKLGYGTSLPASPADGDEYVLVDSTTNPTYQWRFRYNAGSSSAYKWEFVGGAPKLWNWDNAGAASNNAAFTTASGWYWWPGAVPTASVWAVPRSGDYEVLVRQSIQNNSGGNLNFSSGAMAVTAVPGISAAGSQYQSVTALASGGYSGIHTGSLLAGLTVGTHYVGLAWSPTSSPGSVALYGAYVQVIPIRVS